jgi:hypothetical protein
MKLIIPILFALLCWFSTSVAYAGSTKSNRKPTVASTQIFNWVQRIGIPGDIVGNYYLIQACGGMGSPLGSGSNKPAKPRNLSEFGSLVSATARRQIEITLVALLVLISLPLVRFVIFRRRRGKADHQSCIHCKYNLTGTVGAGRHFCPECGTVILG